MNILEVEGLCKTYPAFALRDVSFAVEPGTIMGFIGRNGAGKSTTIKSMLNLVHPDSGRVTMFMPGEANSKTILRKCRQKTIT